MVLPSKSNFNRLPSDEDLKLEAKQCMEEYKLLKEEEMKNESGEDTDDEAFVISETDSSDNEDGENKGQDSEDADDEASEITEASDEYNKTEIQCSKESVKDTDNDNEGNSKGGEDLLNKKNEENVKSTYGSEADDDDIKDIDDGVSNTATKEVNENDILE